MLKTRVLALVAAIVASLMIGSAAAPSAAALGTPLYNDIEPASSSSDSTDGDGEGDDGTDTPISAASGVEITSYKVQSFGVVPDKITDGMAIGLEVTLTDMREEVLEYINAKYKNKKDLKKVGVDGRLNTDSFNFQSQDSFHQKSNLRRVEINGRQGIQYKLHFDLIYIGTGNTFNIDLFYKNKDSGKALDIPIYPLSLTLNQCVEAKEESDEGKEPVVKGTGFVLKSANYGGGNVTAGKEFILSAEVLATNGNTNVENVTVTITPPEEITLAEGSSIAYVGTVAPNQTVPVSFKLFPGANIEDGSYSISVDIRGVDSHEGAEVTTQMTFSVPVAQPERFEIFESQLPDYMMMGMDDGSGMASITLVNQGKSTVNNVSAEIVSEGISSDEGRQYLGHIAGGEEKTADFMLVANEAGEVNAQILVTYENARGDVKTLKQEFMVQVEDGGMIDEPIGEPIDVPAEPQGFPIWGWVLIVVAIIVVVVIVLVVVVKKRKAKQAALDAEDLEDDDEDI